MGRKHGTEARPRGAEALTGPAVLALAEALSVPVLLADPAGGTLGVNRAFRDRVGEVPGAGWLSLVEPSDRGAAESLWLLAGADRAAREAGLRVRTLRGVAPLLCRVTPVMEAGRLLGWVVAWAEAEAAPDPAIEAALASSRSAQREAEAALALARSAQREAEARRVADAAEAEGRIAEAGRRLGEAVRALRVEDGRREAAEDERGELEGQLAHAESRLRDAEARIALAEGRFRESEARRAEAEARAARALGELAAVAERERPGDGRDAEEPGGAEPGPDATGPETGVRDLVMEAELDRLAERLRSGALREGLARWRAARVGGAPPRIERWGQGAPDAAGRVEAELGPGGTPLRLREDRPSPEMALLRALRPEAAGWARAWALRAPVLDTARVGLGPKGAQVIERLVLPFSADGELVDRAVLLMAVEPGESLSRADAEAGRGRRAAGGA